MNRYSHHDEPDEYNITKGHHDYEELNNFLISIPQEKNVNVKFIKDTMIDIEKLKICKQLHPNLYVRLGYWDLYNVPQLQENEINYIFDSDIVINNYVSLQWALRQKPSGIYILDDLHYNLPNVQGACKNNGTSLRIILNRVPVSLPGLIEEYKAPIYRPQDMWVLNQYFDVGEFDCSLGEKKYDWEVDKVQYNAWFVKQYWADDLRLLNPQVKDVVHTPCVPPELADYRSSCLMACNTRIMNVCRKCNRLKEFSVYNFKNNIGYTANARAGLPLKEELEKIMMKKEQDESL